MKKLLALVLALIMSLSFVACGESKDDSKKGDKKGSSTAKKSAEELIVGEWETTFEFAKIMSEDDADETLLEIIEDEGLSLEVVFEFSDNGKFELVADDKSVEKFKKDFTDVMEEYLVATLEAMIGQQGAEMSLDDLLEAQGVTLDELLEEAMVEIDFDEMLEDLEQKGKYEVKDDKLYTYEDEIDEDEYIVFEISDDELEFTKVVTDEEEDALGIANALPLTLERVS